MRFAPSVRPGRAALLLAAAALIGGCLAINEPAPELITVTGLISDSASGLPITTASVLVAFGSCYVSCEFYGQPGTGPVDSTGHYSVGINGSVSTKCGGAYFVQVNAGKGYKTGLQTFACGQVKVAIDFLMQPAPAAADVAKRR